MPIFAYKGRSLRGEAVAGKLEGDTAEMVASRLFNSGVTPIEIVAAQSAESTDVAELWRRIGGGKPRTADLIMFSRQMYTITKSGIPLLRGLKGLSESTHNVVLRRAIEEVIVGLESGRDLATSFGRHPEVFSTLYVSIIRVGESTGTLENSFLRLCEYLAQDQDIQDKVRSALRYPTMVMIAIAAAIAVITIFVIPNFAPLFRVLGNDIPMPTRIIMAVSTFSQQYWWVVLGLIGLAITGARQYTSTDKGRYKWHRFKLRLPVVGKLVHEAILARVSRSLSIGLAAGMPMIQTLNVIARSAGNDFMAERVLRLRDAVERGDPLSRAAATVGMFPPLVLQMMAVGEETGDLSELMDEVAEYYQREVDYTLKNLSALLEPILIIAVGGAVLILALGVFLPMWNMVAKVGAGGAG
ncbi:MAG: type II secretion system F family protein [Candidatus Obscuribacterales bacterium]|nr:type II secretion system F family protein [Steroidobacteraceae bacterium]